MSSSNAARVQGAGPSCTDGDPILVCVQSMPPPSGCTPVEGCPDGEPVVVTGEVVVSGTVEVSNFPATQPVSGTVTANQGAPNTIANAWPSLVVATDTAAALQAILATSSNEMFGGVNPNNIGLYTLSQICIFRDAVGGRPEPMAGDRIDQSENSNINGHNAGYVLSIPTYVGSSGNLLLGRTPDTFKTVATAANGNTALWTPAAGKKFRLMRYRIDVTGNAAAAAAAVKTISLFDGAAGATGQVHSVFVPGAALAAGALYTSGWIDLGNGYLSAAANNVLNVNLSTALTAGVVNVIACGVEE